MTMTTGDLIDTYGVDILDHLDRDDPVPVLTGLQFQGDVAIKPTPDVEGSFGPVPSEGVPVVRGENGGNTHLLLPAPGVEWMPVTGGGVSGLTLGFVRVPPGRTAYLAHPEHGYCGIGEGVFEVRRQREQADEIRMVAD